jgi:hypothetical protein
MAVNVRIDSHADFVEDKPIPISPNQGFIEAEVLSKGFSLSLRNLL